MTDKLLPCPFCGGTDVNLRQHLATNMSWVSCGECGLEAPSETGWTDDHAIEYWNTRAPSSQPRAVGPNTAPDTLWLHPEHGMLTDPLDGTETQYCRAAPIAVSDEPTGSKTSKRDRQRLQSAFRKGVKEGRRIEREGPGRG